MEIRQKLSVQRLQRGEDAPHLTNVRRALKVLGRARPAETAAQYKVRLRRTAMSIPTSIVKAAVESMIERANAIFENDGGDIAGD